MFNAATIPSLPLIRVSKSYRFYKKLPSLSLPCFFAACSPFFFGVFLVTLSRVSLPFPACTGSLSPLDMSQAPATTPPQGQQPEPHALDMSAYLTQVIESRKLAMMERGEDEGRDDPSPEMLLRHIGTSVDQRTFKSVLVKLASDRIRLFLEPPPPPPPPVPPAVAKPTTPTPAEVEASRPASHAASPRSASPSFATNAAHTAHHHHPSFASVSNAHSFSTPPASHLEQPIPQGQFPSVSTASPPHSIPTSPRLGHVAAPGGGAAAPTNPQEQQYLRRHSSSVAASPSPPHSLPQHHQSSPSPAAVAVAAAAAAAASVDPLLLSEPGVGGRLLPANHPALSVTGGAGRGDRGLRLPACRACIEARAKAAKGAASRGSSFGRLDGDAATPVPLRSIVLAVRCPAHAVTAVDPALVPPLEAAPSALFASPSPAAFSPSSSRPWAGSSAAAPGASSSLTPTHAAALPVTASQVRGVGDGRVADGTIGDADEAALAMRDENDALEAELAALQRQRDAAVAAGAGGHAAQRPEVL